MARTRSPHGIRVSGQLRRLPLTDDPVVYLGHPPQLTINLDTITDVRQPLQAIEKYRPVVKPDGVASGAIATL